MLKKDNLFSNSTNLSKKNCASRQSDVKNYVIQSILKIGEDAVERIDHINKNVKNAEKTKQSASPFENNFLNQRQLQRELNICDSRFELLLKNLSQKILDVESRRMSLEARLQRIKKIERIYYQETGVRDELNRLGECISYGEETDDFHYGAIFTRLYMLQNALKQLKEIPADYQSDIIITTNDLPDVVRLKQLRNDIDIDADDAYDKICDYSNRLEEITKKWSNILSGEIMELNLDRQEESERLLTGLISLQNILQNHPIEEVSINEISESNLQLARELMTFAKTQNFFD